ncbi:amino acid ABC transporter substrate-binding protein/permease [Pseudoclavibacter caeni]|jgi:glutamine transport system permease protein|uniref:ABC transporter permease subunit n=1 Tax=Pseudoclavibacter caeni TaxID=908846 RepID=A0A7C8FTA7_9MICO|nr:amino acid ABC transporter substrate-binding protein/permease [Pseudoclavibacter caeni]KAB1631099.1 ABC transporter permease subunit [Pseudoclavibacter caeni]NYJ97445.1 polar amino acid transport system substrate-binding protein [Pseudoclavibacter caeni]
MHTHPLATTRWRGVATAIVALVVALIAMLTVVLPTSSARADEQPTDPSSPVAGQTFRIATDTTFAPFEYRDASGELVGIDMDLIRDIAAREGFEVEIQSLGFNAALQALSANQVDAVIAGMSITDERRQVYDFTDSYFQSGVQMAIAESDDEIHSYDDLNGRIVAVKTGSEGEKYAKSIQGQYGFTIDAVDQSSTMYEKVKSGNAAAVIDDYPVLAYGIAQGNGLKTVTDKVPGGDYAMAVGRGTNADLVTAFNRGLASMKADGSYDQLIDSYLADPSSRGGAQGGFWQLARQAFPALMLGLRNTVLITLMSFGVAMVLGFLFGLMRVSEHRWLDGIARVYVAVFRGTPLLVWAFFFYFGVPQLIGHPVNIWVAGVLTLSLNAGAYITEIIRGAVQSVDPGQLEAARSLGLGYRVSMRRVVVPQAVKIATPSLINQMVIMIKDSSLLLAIGFAELLYQGQQIYAANFRVTETLLLVAIIYFVAISLLTWLANVIDRRINR